MIEKYLRISSDANGHSHSHSHSHDDKKNDDKKNDDKKEKKQKKEASGEKTEEQKKATAILNIVAGTYTLIHNLQIWRITLQMEWLLLDHS